jgi:hypothetical protein
MPMAPGKTCRDRLTASRSAASRARVTDPVCTRFQAIEQLS